MSDLETLVAKDRIATCIHSLFGATDARRWEAVRDCFADSVRFDMTSLAGGSPATLSPEQIAAGWAEGLAKIPHVHHQAGNLEIRVEGERAEAHCHGIAFHHRPTRDGRDTRTFVGTYDFELVRAGGRWRIDLFRFQVRFVDGNPDLEKSPPPA